MLIVDALLDASHHDAAQPTDVEHEIATYLDLPPIPRTSCPRAWWRLQWLKCYGTQGNAVPPPSVYSLWRSPTSNTLKTQGNSMGTMRDANNRV